MIYLLSHTLFVFFKFSFITEFILLGYDKYKKNLLRNLVSSQIQWKITSN